MPWRIHWINEQSIDALIITDPIYSAGIEISPLVYKNLAALCNRLGIWLICDHSLGGLHWHRSLSLIDFEKVEALLRTPKSIYLDSLTKRLFLNGVKHAVIVAPSSLIAMIHDLASRISGGFCTSQLSVLQALFSPENEADILSYMDRIRKKIRSQYRLVETALLGTNYAMYHSNTGHFSMVCHSHLRLCDVDSRNTVELFLNDHDIYVLPSEHFYYSKTSRFGFRINLVNDVSTFLPCVVQAVTQNANFFNKP